MKLVIMKNNIKLKLAFLILLLVSFEVISLTNKSAYEIDRLKKAMNLIRENKETKKNELKMLSNQMRFKAKLRGDSDENNDILVNSVVTDTKKAAATPEEGEIEIYASSATAKTEFSWGFLFWSFMNFGASNALSGHSGYWLSERNAKHDNWDASFSVPQKIDVVQIQWRLPPKKMKIFYKLDQETDWIPATEIFSRDELKDKQGNKIPIGSSSDYNTIYFKKPLLCTEFRIMMNLPVKKKSFSIEKVYFFQKISKGIIKTSVDPKKSCWYINTDVPRENVPIFTYPCTKVIMAGTGNEIFESTTNKMIKSLASGLCVGYSEVTKEVLLKSCENEGSAYVIQYNLDSSMYFDRNTDTAIYMDQKSDVTNFINSETEIITSSEADQNQYKKENILLKGENYWASVPGQQDVTIQFIFGKIKCDCKENGAYEKRIIDIIRISWEREPLDFSVYIWNPGFSWKNIYATKGNTSKSTEISLIAETATGMMIRMTNGNKLPDLGDMVSYAIKSVVVGFKGYLLKYGAYKDRSIDTRLFEFEVQNFITKASTKDYNQSLQSLGQNFEKSVSAYKLVKTNLPSIDKVKKQGSDMCKKLHSFSSTVGEEAIASLNNFKQNSLKGFENSQFTEALTKFGEASALASVVGSKASSLAVNANFSASASLSLSGGFSAKLSAGISFIETDNSIEEVLPSVPTKIFSSGISSKPKEENEEIPVTKIGTKETPAENCLHIRKLDSSSISGFYYIKPECVAKAFRVFCDFTIYGDSVDIYIFKDGSYLPNPDMSYLNINKASDIKAQCAKYGLSPIDLQNRDMVERIFQLLMVSGMDLSQDNYVPLGYDYSCKNNKCSNIYNSLTSSNSLPIMNLFPSNRYPGENPSSNGRFAGFGKINEASIVTFDASQVKISALICSSNKFSGEYSDNPASTISCSMNVSNNQNLFPEGKDIVVICPKACQKTDSPIFGAGLYHGDSSICKSAIHQGVIGGDGGKVVVRIQSTADNYNGSLLNGIKSQNHGNDGLKAFIVIKFSPNCPYFPPNAGSSFIEESEYLHLKSFEESSLDLIKKENLLKGLLSNNSNYNKSNNTNDSYRFMQVGSENSKSFGADAGASLSGLTSSAANTASDLLGLMSNTQQNLAAGLNGFGTMASNAISAANNAATNAASQLANSFGINLQKPSIPIPKADPGSSRGLGSQPTTPEDIAPQLSLNAGLGGTYKYGLPESANNYSISDPAPNQNSSQRGLGPSPYDNIPLAMARSQSWVDPNLASTVPLSGTLSNINFSVNANNPTPEVYQVPDNLLGSGSLKAGIDLGASSLDLTQNSKPLVDPTNSTRDEAKGALSIGTGLTVSAGLALGLNPDTTASAKAQLNRLYDASVGSYLSKLKAKANKIAETINNFSTALNQAVSGVGDSIVKAADIAVNAAGSAVENTISAGTDTLKAGANVMGSIAGGISVGISGSTAIYSASSSVSSISSNSKTIVGSISGVSSCSLATIDSHFKKMSEYKEKISGQVENIKIRGQARILKVKKIREKFKEKLASFELQAPVKIDFSAYASVEIARKEIFTETFTITRKREESIKANWDVTSKNIKGRKRAIGTTESDYKSDCISSSFMMLQEKEFYDFKLTIDLLFLSKGIAGVAFRVKDQFNYYAFIVDKIQGFKAIGKMVNGDLIIMKKVSDGGILLNEWHSVIITVKAGNISVYMYDKETASKASSEKTISIEDYTYAKGSAAVFINGVKGFYFDNFNIEPLKCWSPWQPKSNIQIKNTNTNIYYEDFRGTFEEKYTVIDIQEFTVRDGPAVWTMVYENSALGSYIKQSSTVFDTSSQKMSSFTILKEKNFSNGVYKVHFEPEKLLGTISIIFKYSKESSITGEVKEQFYSFDLMNETEPVFKFRKWKNGEVKIINSINVSQVKGLSKAYVLNKENIVEVEYVNDRVTIRLSQDNIKFYDIMNVVEDTIKYGSVGFGTSYTPAKFSGIYIEPLKIKLTPSDIDIILNKNLDSIPFPSVVAIKKMAESIQSIMTQMIKNTNALGYVLSQISLLGSSLGFDLKSDKRESPTTSSTSGAININTTTNGSLSDKTNKDSMINSSGWRVCISSRGTDERKKYCEQSYNNPILQEKCEKNFCTECCEKNIDPIHGNLIHVCKKTCFKSTIAVDTTEEYKNVCITSPDSRSNVYEYCEQKMNQFSLKSKEACKLDMCNLCCVTMDAMKKKNYSVNNLKKCFKDCNHEYNSSPLLNGQISSLFGKIKDEDCKDKKNETIDYNNIYNSENFFDLKKFKEEIGVPLYPSANNNNQFSNELERLQFEEKAKASGRA